MRPRLDWLAVGGLLALSGGSASGSGFAVVERDAAGLGRAYAGQAAVVAAGSLSVNPAALPERATLSGSMHGLRNRLAPDGGVDALIPALYGTYRGFGVGLYAPFGLSTDYSSDWSGRYAALFSEIRAARIQIAGGVQASESLRVGAGVFLQHLSAELSQAYPLGGSVDSRIRVDGEDTAPGWSIGALWQPRADLSLGLAFTSPVAHTLRGRAELPGGGASTRVALTTPETLSAGLGWQARPGWRLLGGATWTRWSRLQSLDIRLSDGAVLSEAHAWRDTWRVGLGGEYARGPWTLRLGTAWDQSPVPDAAHRYPRLPDSDRTWGSLGLGYRRGDWQWDLGYAHLRFADRRGEHPALDYRSSTDIVALGITRSW
jgi:long-chain fatty acid transport protein